MNQTLSFPSTIGQVKTEDFIKSLENLGDSWVSICPFCERHSTLHLPNDKNTFFCVSCWVVGSRDELGALLKGDGYEAMRNLRRAENRKQTEHNCRASGFTFTKYIPPDHHWQADADINLYRNILQFENYGKYGFNQWLMKRGISDHVATRYGIGLWVTKIQKFTEYGDIIHARNLNGALRGIVIPNYRGKKLIRIRIITHNGSMSFPKDLSPTPAFLKGVATPSRIYFIVKNELEMILLSGLPFNRFNVVSLGEPEVRPDRELHLKLRNSDLILVCLDNKSDGMSGYSRWWLDIYPQARWYPYPVGESLNDAYMQGVDIEAHAKNALKAILAEPPTCGYPQA